MSVVLRLATASDADAVRAIYAPFVRETAVSFESEVPSADEIAARIEATLARLPWLVAEDGGQGVLGYAYASSHRARASYRFAVEVSVYLAPAARRRGLGTALYGRLFEILRAQGYRRALAGATLPNPGSTRLHTSLGFEAVGVYRAVGFKQGAWHDVGWYQKELLPPDPDPPEPRALSEVSVEPRVL